MEEEKSTSCQEAEIKAGKPAKKRKHPILDHPIPGYFLLVFFAIFVETTIGAFVTGLLQPFVPDAAGLVGTVVSMLIYLCWFKFHFRPEYKGSLGFQHFREGVGILIIPVAIECAFALYDAARAGMTSRPLAALAMGMIAGFGEEYMFRTVGIANYMRVVRDEKKIPVILWVSALGFGLLHLSNLAGGADPGITVVQVLSTIGTGLLFGAVYIRTADIWPCILAHGIYDFICFLEADLLENTGIMTETLADMAVTEWISTAVAIPSTIIGIAAVSAKYRPRIIAVWDERWSRS